MENENGKLMGRRRALQMLGIGIGLVGLGSCDDWKRKGEGGGSGPAASNKCEDKAPQDDNAKQLRKNLQYKEQTDTPAKKCSLCVQFEAAKYGECGGCKLFQGAVNPNGVCLSFAPKDATPPGVPASPPGVAPPAAPPGSPPAAPPKG